jgi:hypothetical protein
VHKVASPGLRRFGAIGLAATTSLMLGVAAAPAAAADPYVIPGVDEISSSSNLELIANVPKFGAFAVESAYNTDLAFQGDYAFQGNYNGFVIWDIAEPTNPQVVSQVVCPGSQNDISVYGNLVFLSTDSSRSDDSCNSTSQSAALKSSWEGMKIFDVTDKANPVYIKSIETDCGSHTHTLVPGKDPNTLYVYVQSYSPNANYPDCQPPHDKITIIKVPLDNPTAAEIVATPNLFPDGGNPGGNGSSATTGCHDITVYAEKNLAAGACMGDGILMDISDRENPRVISRVRDTTNFAFWHSATFNNDGTKVVFTDELGGGSAATCLETIAPEKGANAYYDIVGTGNNRRLEFRSYFKIPRPNTTRENCVAHNGSLIPVMGRDVMVQAWYQGGISVVDFTDSANPVELAYWERGPLSDTRLVLGGSWSTYYHNGYIYSSDIQKGLDVLKLTDPRTDNARTVIFGENNPQNQLSYPNCTSVLTGEHNGDITAKSGVVCLDGATVNGTITLTRGASLLAYQATVTDAISVTGGGLVSLLDSDVHGLLTVSGGSAISVVNSEVNGVSLTRSYGVSIRDSVIDGSATITGNLGAVAVINTEVYGSATVSRNDGGSAPVLSGVVVGGTLACHNNTPAPVNNGVANSAAKATGQCATI